MKPHPVVKATVFARFIYSGLQKIGSAHTWYLNRVLKRQEQTFPSSFFRAISKGLCP
jgi:hypothetical protein